MSHIYNRLALFLQAILILIGLFSFLALNPKTMQFIMQKVSKSAHISYSKVEGTLLFGFDIYDIKYQRSIAIKHLGVHYKFWQILNLSPVIKTINIYKMQIYPERLTSNVKKKDSKKSLPLPPLLIKNINIKKSSVTASSQKIGFNVEVKDILLKQDDISINHFDTAIFSHFADGNFAGKLKNSEIKAFGHVTVSKQYTKMASAYLKNIPKSIPVNLNIDMNRLEVKSTFGIDLGIKDGNLTLAQPRVIFDYMFKYNYFKSNILYTAITPYIYADIDQNIIFTPSLAYAVKLKGTIKKSEYPLPFKSFSIDAAGDKSIVTSDLRAGPINIDLYSSGYNKFALRAITKPHTLAFLKQLPKIFTDQTIQTDSNAVITLKPKPALKGTITVDGNFSTTQSALEYRNKTLLLRSTISPKKKGGIWEHLPPAMISAINSVIYIQPKRTLLNVDTNRSHLTLFESEKKISGWATLGSFRLDANGTLTSSGKANINFITKIESVRTLMKTLGMDNPDGIDAQVKSDFNIQISDRFKLGFYTKIPWYVIQPDFSHVYYGFNSDINGSIDQNKIKISRYSIDLMKHRFVQKRPSLFKIDQNQTLQIDKLSLLDTITAKGYYSLNPNEVSLHIFGKNAHYNGAEGNITANADVKVMKKGGNLKVDGEIKVLKGVITYMPKKSYDVSDEDIIIIQDIRPPDKSSKSIDLHIYSNNKIIYKVQHVKVYFKPDITLWKEPHKPLTLLGMVKVMSGSIDAQNKHFIVQPSNIYFSGAHPINPYLDLHIRYNLDFDKFNIYISHTLASPVFLFSSEPPMSQNDIMSYILFGAPANEAFKGSQAPSNSVGTMLLGLGLKNTIGAATGIKFDTLNILSTKSGGFGVEIGKRLNNRIRIIYRNDEVSSFIIQYKASRNIRIDVDVKDTGQGINILYIKDIK